MLERIFNLHEPDDKLQGKKFHDEIIKQFNENEINIFRSFHVQQIQRAKYL